MYFKLIVFDIVSFWQLSKLVSMGAGDESPSKSERVLCEFDDESLSALAKALRHLEKSSNNKPAEGLPSLETTCSTAVMTASEGSARSGTVLAGRAVSIFDDDTVEMPPARKHGITAQIPQIG